MLALIGLFWQGKPCMECDVSEFTNRNYSYDVFLYRITPPPPPPIPHDEQEDAVREGAVRDIHNLHHLSFCPCVWVLSE